MYKQKSCMIISAGDVNLRIGDLSGNIKTDKNDTKLINLMNNHNLVTLNNVKHNECYISW